MAQNSLPEYAVCIKKSDEIIDQVNGGKKCELVPGEFIEITQNRTENCNQILIKIYDYDKNGLGKNVYQCDRENVKRLSDEEWTRLSSLRVGTNVTLHLELMPSTKMNVNFIIKSYGDCPSLGAGRFFSLDLIETPKLINEHKFNIQMKYYESNQSAYVLRADKLIEALMLENSNGTKTEKSEVIGDTVQSKPNHFSGSAAPPISTDINVKLPLKNENCDLIVPNSAETVCISCKIPLAILKGYVLQLCNHAYCQSCITSQLRTYVQDDELEKLKCRPRINNIKCDRKFELCELKYLLSDQIYQQFIQRLIDANQTNSYIKMCYDKNCSGYYLCEKYYETEFLCGKCNLKNCRQCEAIHDGINCAQYGQLMARSIDKDTIDKLLNLVREFIAEAE